ncbi:MAG: hypothetical protein ACFFED_05015 [Candidatus Thorarchaeota archaeon]
MGHRSIDDNLEMDSSNVCRLMPTYPMNTPSRRTWMTSRNLGWLFTILGLSVFLLLLLPGLMILALDSRDQIRQKLQFSNKQKAGIIVAFLFVGLFAWSPWLSIDVAEDAVVESLGGPDAMYNYLGENRSLRDIPMNSIKVPFGVLVYFPFEAVYIVPFWGIVIDPPDVFYESD